MQKDSKTITPFQRDVNRLETLIQFGNYKSIKDFLRPMLNDDYKNLVKSKVSPDLRGKLNNLELGIEIVNN